MIAKRAAAAMFVLGAVWCAACQHIPGRPVEKDRWVAPAQITDFDQLYTQNCSGCHGASGKLGPACPLNDPLYLSVAGPDDLEQVIARGVPSTSMPAFGRQFGGSLTDAQIKLLVDQMRSRWGQPNEFTGVQLPPYRASQSPGAVGATSSTGDAAKGAQVFGMYCAQCHGSSGTGGPKAGSVIDPSYLSLVSDQSLRTTVIAGRQDVGQPDWRSDLPGHAMSPEDISDVVAWISAQRPKPQATGTANPVGSPTVPVAPSSSPPPASLGAGSPTPLSVATPTPAGTASPTGTGANYTVRK